MAGFIRRFGFFPGTEVITQIEGAVIVDLAPPGSVQGVGTGVVACVGEFADASYGVSVAADGTVSTNPQPVEVYSAQDMLNKVGGFDETIGETHVSGGNAFLGLRGKKFSRLILVPVNLASDKAGRMFRELPYNTSLTVPTPIVALQAGSVSAGREFRSGSSRARTMKLVNFTALGAYKQAVDGAVVAGSSSPTQTFGSATGAFTTCKNGGPVQAGDILVLDVAAGTNCLQLRVTADATVATQLTVEKMDGSNFNWTTNSALPYRIHYPSDAESGTGNAASTAACTVPARPLDATITSATLCSPTVVPTGHGTDGKSWDPLTGLKFRTHASGSLTYTAAVQAPNAASASGLQGLYGSAFDALLTDNQPARDVNIVLAARTDATIRAKVKQHVINASSQGLGRVACISPEINTVSIDTVLGDASPGVGAQRDERIFYAWPGAKTLVPEAVGYSLKGADAVATTDGLLDIPLCFWLASLLSNLAPERNPGQSTDPVPGVMASILAMQRGAPAMNQGVYINLRAKGIAGLRFDKTAGYIFQSGVTTSLTSGQKNISRRRMADFCEDSIAERFNQFAKQPLTNALKDSILGEAVAFCEDLLSPNNPAAQRIDGYLVDDKSGNTPEMTARGIHVVIVKIRMTPTADFIVLQAEVGESVNVTAQ